MRRKLLIPCPSCNEGKSQYYRDAKITCQYCRGAREVDILEHHALLGITDERHSNVKSFIADPRFTEYLTAKHG